MPRPSKTKQREAPLPSRTLIIDNGAYTLKAGFTSDSAKDDAELLEHCHSIPNALARTRDKRTYIASQLDDKVSDWTDAIFRRPVEKGQIVSWEAQKAIWDHTFFDEKTALKDLYVKDVADTTLVLTEPPNVLPPLQKNADEIVMEEWGFGAYTRVIGPTLNAFHDIHPLMGDPEPSSEASKVSPVECLLVIDSGYSHTTITPVYKSRPIQRAIRRLDFGGKHLTNMLKELVSTRHYDLHQDTYIVNDIKEQTCFVSQDFKSDLEATWKGNPKRNMQTRKRPLTPPESDTMDLDDVDTTSPSSLLIDYILPDGLHVKQGYTRPHNPLPTAHPLKRKQASSSPFPSTTTTTTPTTPTTTVPETSMTLSNERFTVPEILFTPSDIGSPQPGIPDLVLQSLSTLPPALQATMLSNILVVGGNANTPGFVERVESEVRARASVECVVRARKMAGSSGDPVRSTWLGGARMAAAERRWDGFRGILVTKEEYAEFGSAWAGRKFAAAGGAAGIS